MRKGVTAVFPFTVSDLRTAEILLCNLIASLQEFETRPQFFHVS